MSRSRQEKLTDYEGFVEKFKPKKTTDDCCTPPEIYEVIKDYACRRWDIDPEKVVRPFWPGGDYEAFDYSDGAVVIDNPPFSILGKICKYYTDGGIPFFLFAPSLTAFSGGGDARQENQPHHLRLRYNLRERRSRSHVVRHFLRPAEHHRELSRVSAACE